ncbi:MAG: AI-2E family transporter [Acidobacteriota bacterium]
MAVPDQELRLTARHAFVFWGVAALLLALAIAVRIAAPILILTFGGLLFGIWLRGAAESLARHAHMRVGWAIAICVVVLGLVLFVGLEWVAPHVQEQAGPLWNESVQAVRDLRAQLGDSLLGRLLSTDTIHLGAWIKAHALLAGTFVIDVFGVLGSIVYVAFVGLYYAASPRLYRRGMLALVPRSRRERIDQLCDELGWALRRWMWARLASMILLGAASTLALWLLGIPLALTLGVLAGVLLFVPYLGSIASAIPALLVALTVSPMHVVYVAIVYVLIHLADGYLLTPQLLNRAVDTPPLVLLAAQLVAGALWGLIGITFATPLVACAMIVVKRLYVDDVLETPAPDS